MALNRDALVEKANEIFDAAGFGRELYNLQPPEDALYSRARLIYYKYRHREIDEAAGAGLRREAVMLYIKTKEAEEFERRWIDAAAKMYHDVELAATEYRKNPGYATADAMEYAIYKILNDNKEKWEEEDNVHQRRAGEGDRHDQELHS